MSQHGGVPVTYLQVCITESKYRRRIYAVTTTTQPPEQLNYSLRRTRQNKTLRYWRKNAKTTTDKKLKNNIVEPPSQPSMPTDSEFCDQE
jgi:hypothetical protein